MENSIEDYVSCGYLITQFVDGAAYNQWMKDFGGATENLLPGNFLSIGLCGADHAPVLRWTGETDENYTRFGIPIDRISELDLWANERLNKEIGYPNLFFQLSTAQEYVQRFTIEANDLQLLGIALHEELLSQIAEIEWLYPDAQAESGAKIAGFASTGFAQALRLGKQPPQGEILGFDLICCTSNIDHSWHCNGLAVDGLGKFNFRPNQFGLINDKTNADDLVHYANATPTEPGIWLPVLVMRYPLKSA